MKLLTIFGLLLLIESAFAGNIRTIQVSSKEMRTIHLKLGQSTVLRFRETPKKVVVGNQNYFNVEFIGNDITIQPQGPVKTNLFVYGEYHTFGFILKAGNYNQYDDLVNVLWKSSKMKRKKRVNLSVKTIKRSIKLKSKLTCYLEKVTELKPKFYVLDFRLFNEGKKIISINDVDLFLTRSKIKLPKQRLIFSSQRIEKNLGIKGRIFFNLKKKEGFSLQLFNKDDVKKTIISRKFL
ncbi:MAG: hypothetical protein CME70_10965 [Halobacteriovorax sp.]|nr:hypothetical protein [Halobacteriovorax sp.]|tara:strand:+ start:33862 stop:34572 length:711 start_codon:yes stop_codon:yes gene_type:complete